MGDDEFANFEFCGRGHLENIVASGQGLDLDEVLNVEGFIDKKRR